ncbi:hypothetical protein K440DRAFT_590710 [Wilcoxina mikolae CBS 423.85]|nr:hypothetical protein K440DRAFT_590710 [Wilcoxina mikolae CBS 423.85]
MTDDSHRNDSDNDYSSLPVYFRDLRGQNPQHIIDAFTQANSGPITNAIATSLGALSHIDLRALTERLINTLSDREFRDQFLRAITQHIKNHPYQTAFLVVGVILLMNPLAIIGFGSLGPVAGSIAAGWQATMGGTVAAGSAFATLQGMGMLAAVAIPATGAAIIGTTAVAAVATQQGVWKGANAAGAEVERWAKGDYGEPVTKWWNGDYGEPIKNWWGGTEMPVANWWGQVTRRD